ncbi:MAG: hypothetical protein ABG776_09620 [Cyanobacteria bacterium J06555_13]
MTLTISSANVSLKHLMSALPSIPPNDADFAPWGSAQGFLAQYAASTAMHGADAHLHQLHASLTRNASVCNFCGVGCSYGVVVDSRDN